ncbi:hypothetical protein K435DRAFT_875952 [Dendrothele bispora CBS 962.96]|uniref:Uncharacterized protein n=1 Tax=Dendrothele bispora (strain CBS 962.96) TaxID=1314807 RepID=A0A4S8KTL3_DENBC|nr:hypothetical protein K435DRAFT_875952 [Dendrothele bispora CBS 962.96]
MNTNTDNPNIPNNGLPPPPMLALPTTSNTVTSPLDSLEPASAVSVPQANGGISMSMTASSIYIDKSVQSEFELVERVEESKDGWVCLYGI